MINWSKEKLERVSYLVSLPLALISIASIVVPPAWEFLRGDFAKLEVTLVTARFWAMEIMVTNVGNKAAVITGVELDASMGEYTNIHFFQVPAGKRIVDPGEQFVLKNSNGQLIHGSAREFREDTDLPERTCEARVRCRQFDSTTTSSAHRYRCMYVEPRAAGKLEDVVRAGVEIPWNKIRVDADGPVTIPDKKLLEWARSQPEPKQNLTE